MRRSEPEAERIPKSKGVGRPTTWTTEQTKVWMNSPELSALQMTPRVLCDIQIAFMYFAKLQFVELFQVEQLIAGQTIRADYFVQLDLKSLRIPVLSVLN